MINALFCFSEPSQNKKSNPESEFSLHLLRPSQTMNLFLFL